MVFFMGLWLDMEREFTPGALRALAAAATWQLGDTFDGLRPVTILMGLLAEPECRAAVILRSLGIDEETVLRRWPELRRICEPPVVTLDATPAFHTEADSLFQAVDMYMDWGDWPPIISTEHLLLGLAAGNQSVAEWLREMGLCFQDLLNQILERYGTASRWRSPEITPESLGPEAEKGLGLGLGPPEGPEIPPSAIESAEIIAGEMNRDNRGRTWALPDACQERPTDKLARVSEMQLFRIADAAINRALEGLRVIEDYTRFVLDDPFLVREIKSIRHELGGVVSAVPMSLRLAARETQHDVGTEIKAHDELRRRSGEELLDANFSRVREAMRSLEECVKLLVPNIASAIERLRYRCYTLQRAVRISARASQRLRRAQLYVLVDARNSEAALRELVQSLVAAGVHVIQLREKHLRDRELLARARLVRELTRGSDTLFIMNDRPDLAVLSGADGVHVGQEELTVKDARLIVGADALVGVSTHNIEQARQAVLDGASYIGCGPTFPSATKEFSEFSGLDYLRQVAEEIRLPAFAIGGINEENLESVLATGFRRVAVSSSVVQSANPGETARRLLSRLSS
ncbi:MAG: thiamine phosphate synthase [Thermogutta sp.]